VATATRASLPSSTPTRRPPSQTLAPPTTTMACLLWAGPPQIQHGRLRRRRPGGQWMDGPKRSQLRVRLRFTARRRRWRRGRGRAQGREAPDGGPRPQLRRQATVTRAVGVEPVVVAEGAPLDAAGGVGRGHCCQLCAPAPLPPRASTLCSSSTASSLLLRRQHMVTAIPFTSSGGAWGTSFHSSRLPRRRRRPFAPDRVPPGPLPCALLLLPLPLYFFSLYHRGARRNVEEERRW
jgi:hypothetical protein